MFWGFPSGPPASSVPWEAPNQLFSAVRTPWDFWTVLGVDAASWWLATWYLRAPPASPLHPPMRDGTEEDVINRAAPLGLAASGTSSGWFNFPWCLSFSASISLFFLSPNLPSCAYSYREPQLRLVTMAGQGGMDASWIFYFARIFFFFDSSMCFPVRYM